MYAFKESLKETYTLTLMTHVALCIFLCRMHVCIAYVCACACVCGCVLLRVCVCVHTLPLHTPSTDSYTNLGNAAPSSTFQTSMLFPSLFLFVTHLRDAAPYATSSTFQTPVFFLSLFLFFTHLGDAAPCATFQQSVRSPLSARPQPAPVWRWPPAAACAT